MASKPSIPKGTRDFSSTEVAKRNYIFSIIKSNFEQFGFQPIETPAMELLSTLTGKYGEEGDRLIFKIFPRGQKLRPLLATLNLTSKIIEEEINVNVPSDKFSEETLDRMTSVLTNSVTEEALRYDLTVPFARYVVQHQNELEFPFKRYQIQPVWRADRPQKGRFREFFQCDADVVGSNSLWQEVEFVQLYDTIFTALGLKGVHIKINNRKILSGIADVIGASDKLIDFTVALDKLDKIGEDGVKKEMLEKGISEAAIEKVQPLFNFTGTIPEKIEKLATLLASSNEGLKGVEELKFICNAINELGLKSANLDVDVTLARGLNYYTGAIYEVGAPTGIAMGSIGGGGRYDDLTGIFGLKNMSGVGISFGLDRIYLVLEELGLFPETVTTTSKALFINFGEAETLFSLKAISQVRQNNIKVEMYPDAAKMAKQFQFAEKKGIQFAVLVGEEEIKQNQYKIKDLISGEQETVSLDQLIEKLK
jgi:histidyl-tRNA synthetase